MAKINPYLNFKGNAEEAFNFYRSVFGGEFRAVMRWKEMPGSEKFKPEDREKIMHISLPIGKDDILMASDTVGQEIKEGNNFGITINTETKEEANKLFNSLSKGGHVTMPLDTAFWGDYFGSFNDKYGIQWMVVCSNKE